MILFYGNISFQDVIVSMDEWKTIKHQGTIAPFGQLPSMRLPTGDIIAQTGAIVRYVAKLARIYPSDPVEAARADMIFEFAQELNMINPLLNFWPVITDTWKTNYDTFFKTLPQHLASADRLLGSGPFFGGRSPHHGDFALFHVLESCATIQAHCLDMHPRLQEFMNAMLAIPSVTGYLQNRLPPAKVGLCGSYMQAEIAKSYTHF